MYRVGNYGHTNKLGLTDDKIKGYLGSNALLNKAYKEGKFNTILTFWDEPVGSVCFPGFKMSNAVVFIELLKYIIKNFEIKGERGRHFVISDSAKSWNMANIFTAIDTLCEIRNTGEIEEFGKGFSGEEAELYDKVVRFLKACKVNKIPIGLIEILPLEAETFSLEYLEGRKSGYLGYRERVYKDIKDNVGDFEMLCEYREVPGEYVVYILI